MKTLYFTVLFFLASIFSCRKNETYLQNEGVITGIDLSGCPCSVQCPCVCGGYFFHFTDMDDTSRVIIDNRLLIQLPSDVKFPVRLILDWQNTNRCGIKAIRVANYKLL